jgi:hypothetical protein
MEYMNNSYYSDPTVFEVSSHNVLKKNYESESGQILQNSSIIPVTIELCSKYYTPEMIIEKNIQIPLDLFYCIKPDEFYLKGFWGSKDTYSSISIIVTKCKNSTTNNFHCKSEEFIESIIQDGYISFDFTSFETDQKNYTDPLKKYFITILTC